MKYSIHNTTAVVHLCVKLLGGSIELNVELHNNEELTEERIFEVLKETVSMMRSWDDIEYDLYTPSQSMKGTYNRLTTLTIPTEHQKTIKSLIGSSIDITGNSKIALLDYVILHA